MLEPNQQPIFKKLTSKLNKLAQIIRPDSEYLSTRCGIAARSDMIQIAKLTRRVNETPNKTIIPNLGKPENWILVGVVSASHRISGNVPAVGGHIIMLINKHTKAASTIHWTSNRIERKIHSSAAAEAIAMQEMFDSLLFTRRVLAELCGKRVSNLQCVVFSSNQELLSEIHRHVEDDRVDLRIFEHI